MPQEPVPPTRPRTSARVRRGPSPRRFAAGALAGFVAVFGVLALRVHDGDDPALASGSSSGTSPTSTTAATSTTTDPYDSGTSSSDDTSSGDSPSSGPSSTSGATTSAS